MSTLEVKVPESLWEPLHDLAKQEGVSVNQFIVTAVAEKMSVLMTESYLNERGQRGRRERYEAALAEVPDAEPEPRDRRIEE